MKLKLSITMPLDLPVALAMIVIGSEYSSEEYCRIPEIPRFLIVAGSVYFVTALLRYTVIFPTCCKINSEKKREKIFLAVFFVEGICNTVTVFKMGGFIPRRK